MKFSAPTIAMLASSASIASATKIVKTYTASPATSSHSTATDSGSGSRRLDSSSSSSKSSKASGKSGKANPTGLASYTACPQALVADLFTSSDLPLPLPETLPFLPTSLDLGVSPSGNFALSDLIGNLGCGWFGLNSTACDDDGYTTLSIPALTSTLYAEATGGNPFEFAAAGGLFPDNIIDGEAFTTAGEGLITTYSLKCATPPVTKFETDEGLRPVNICSFEIGFQNTELDLISETEAVIALYPESDNVVCNPLTEEE